jgi:hypothetical protein
MPDPTSLHTVDTFLHWVVNLIVGGAGLSVLGFGFRLTRWATRLETDMKSSFKANDEKHDEIAGNVEKVVEEVSRINGDVGSHGEAIAILKVVCPNMPQGGNPGAEDC